jgi:hypothetical protein
MFGWFRRAPAAPTDEQLRLTAALAGYPPYSPPKWNLDPEFLRGADEACRLEFLRDANEAYREYFFGNRHLRLDALGEFFAKFDVDLTLDDAGLTAISTWLPKYADLLVDDFNSDAVRDAYQEFASPWTGAFAGLSPIFDLGIYYAECIWLRRTKLKWIVTRGPDRGGAWHFIYGLPGGRPFDPMHYTYNHCRNIWVSKRAIQKRLPFSNDAWVLRSESFCRHVLSQAPPGRRSRKQGPERPSP